MNSEFGIRWVVFVRVADRNGALTALAGVFSERGVSFESLNTLDVYGGAGLMSISFVSSDRLARVLVRTLDRLAVVSGSLLRQADDPQVRAVAVVDTSGSYDPEVVQPWPNSQLLAGSLQEVAARVTQLRTLGACQVALMVLPPQ